MYRTLVVNGSWEFVAFAGNATTNSTKWPGYRKLPWEQSGLRGGRCLHSKYLGNHLKGNWQCLPKYRFNYDEKVAGTSSQSRP